MENGREHVVFIVAYCLLTVDLGIVQDVAYLFCDLASRVPYRYQIVLYLAVLGLVDGKARKTDDGIYRSPQFVRDVCEEIVETLGRFLELFDLVIGTAEDLKPSVDYRFRELADEVDHAEVEDDARYHESVEGLAADYQHHDLVDHRDIVGELAERDKGLFAGHNVERDNRGHYDSEIERARIVDAVEEETSHHQDRIDPDADVRGRVMPYVERPGYDDTDEDEQYRPFFPTHEK